MKYPKYKKELANKFYDTIAGNTEYPQITPEQILDCDIDTGSDTYTMYFKMKNGQSIRFEIY